VTDANLLLGYLDAEHFLGGKRKLETVAAERAVDALASRLGITRDEAAAGIYRLINLKMADGIRLMTLRRGVDPRGFTLLSFGGGAGLHACEVAREMEMTRVVVPTVASVLSAWGMLASDLRYEVSRSHIGDTSDMDSARLRDIFASLEDEARQRLGSWFTGPIHIERSAEMRYGEQIFEVDVSLEGLDLACPSVMDELIERFHRRHEELYTYSSPGQEVVLVNARVAAVGEVPAAIEANDRKQEGGPLVPIRTRHAYFDGWRDVPVYALEDVCPGHEIIGPAVIEAETTTVILGIDDRATANSLGWIDIELRGAKTGQ